MMKIIHTITAFALLCFVGIQRAAAVEFGIAVSFLQNPGLTDEQVTEMNCNNENNPQIAKYEEFIDLIVGNSQYATSLPDESSSNWQHYTGDFLRDTMSRGGDRVAFDGDGRKLGCSCYDGCMYGLPSYCSCCWCCYRRANRRNLRVLQLQEERVPDVENLLASGIKSLIRDAGSDTSCVQDVRVTLRRL